MKKLIIGLLLLLLAVVLFAYVGCYVCLYKGIVNTIEGVKTSAPTGYIVKWALLAIFFEVIGAIVAFIPGAIGWYLIVED